MTTPDQRKMILAPHCRYRVIDDTAVLIVQDRGEAIVLNELGTRILQSLDGEIEISQLFEELLAEYDVEPETLRSDLEAFVDELVEAAVLVEVDRA